MLRLNTPDERIVGVLHDVLEDTDVTIEEIINYGASQTIIDAIVLMTKPKGYTYDDYLKRVAVNETARAVKLADIADNMDENRMQRLSETDRQRLTAKYNKALSILNIRH